MVRFHLCCTLLLGYSTAAVIPARRFQPAWNRSVFNTEMDNAFVADDIIADANASALVMIDLWPTDDPILTDNYERRMFPLLAAARKLNFTIIHAPSAGTLLPSITVLPGEFLVVGEDARPGSASRCDGIILNASARGLPRIRHVFLAGYDTNLCMLDKPCGSVQLSGQLQGLGGAELVLLRDVTRPQSRFFQNTWFSLQMNTLMIEMAPWLAPRPSAPSESLSAAPAPAPGIRSALLSDLLQAFAVAGPEPLAPCLFPQRNASQAYPPPAPVPAAAVGATGALVVVSAAGDFQNDGFQARVLENVHSKLLPLLRAARSVSMQVLRAARSGSFTLPIAHQRHSNTN